MEKAWGAYGVLLYLKDELNKLYGYVDSRHDKLADGVSKHIADINAKLNDNTAFVDKLHHSIVDINGKLNPVKRDPAI